MIMVGVGNVVGFVGIGVVFFNDVCYLFGNDWVLVYIEIIVGILNSDILGVVVVVIKCCFWEIGVMVF